MVNTVKVYKKTSPNGKLSAYLNRRDFIDHLSHTSPIDGVVLVEEDYLKGRRVFASIMVTFRHGHEEEEVMGLHFSKEYEVFSAEVLPKTDDTELSPVQNAMVQKLGNSARPFSLVLPEKAPLSVTLEPGTGDTDKPLGVTYELTFYVAEEKEEKPHKRSSVSFAVRKVQFAPSCHDIRRPYTVVKKGFTLSAGQLNLEVGLGRDIYFHGQSVETCISINNKSKRTVKSIVAQVIQHVEVTMTNNYISRVVASIESSEGCPITPDANFERTIDLIPVASNMRRFGIALDGKVKDEDVNLASSTIGATGDRSDDALGIIVSYSVLVKLLCGAIGGELVAEIPFKLMHPDPDAQSDNHNHNVEFEEFSNYRRGKSLDEELQE